MYTTQVGDIVENVGKRMPKIYETLDNRWNEKQAHMIEIEGKINNSRITILIKSRSSHSCIDPRLVEKINLKKTKHCRAWLVQLATREKRKIIELVKEFPLTMNGIKTRAYLNVIPLGSYAFPISMD